MASSSPFAAPQGWALTQLAIHEERIDDTGGVPFTGTVVVHLRMDAPRGSQPADILKSDREAFEKSFDDFELVNDGTLGANPVLEYKLTQQGHELQQMVVYFVHNDDVYALTATHRSGDSFERVRKTAEELLGSMLG